MITWRDEGFVLSSRLFEENSVILDVFTPNLGRHSGVVRGGNSRKMRPHLQPGAQLDIVWKARLNEHLGAFTIEPIRSRAAVAMADRLSLTGLTAVCALLAAVMPERQAHEELYYQSQQLLDLLGQNDLWPLAYLRWEQGLLARMGFALQLERCAVTGTTEDLAYVSPKTGRAVSRSGAGDWADRLLALPDVLRGQGMATPAEIVSALSTTGWFVENRLLAISGQQKIPEARARLIAEIAKKEN